MFGYLISPDKWTELVIDDPYRLVAKLNKISIKDPIKLAKFKIYKNHHIICYVLSDINKAPIMRQKSQLKQNNLAEFFAKKRIVWGNAIIYSDDELIPYNELTKNLELTYKQEDYAMKNFNNIDEDIKKYENQLITHNYIPLDVIKLTLPIIKKTLMGHNGFMSCYRSRSIKYNELILVRLNIYVDGYTDLIHGDKDMDTKYMNTPDKIAEAKKKRKIKI